MPDPGDLDWLESAYESWLEDFNESMMRITLTARWLRGGRPTLTVKKAIVQEMRLHREHHPEILQKDVLAHICTWFELKFPGEQLPSVSTLKRYYRPMRG
jgi:hypothetical protein